ncbi:TetR/AcrR family transcriptional regulator [Promicromonospora iranensis]|uniref:AcrR family transcriptional regulator n=1 Tax=Promicromonospora iranensis TaxID=1105144 RepID=A0ABU2CT41_9MICO|nr:TetR/AcrR family transcriptional regulator [Promicromonospora iranensis]MDR7384451.1 AcrR family transcriptional regulator [Promicromonospora iranensis]
MSPAVSVPPAAAATEPAPVQSRRERLRDELRREVLAAARHQLAGQHGLSKLTMAAVAKEVGVTPPALYRHFENRQDVIAQLCVLIVEEVLELLGAAVARQDPGDIAAALVASTRTSLDWAVRNPAEFDLVIGSGIRAELPDSHALQRRMAEMVGGHYVPLFRELAAAGIPRPADDELAPELAEQVRRYRDAVGGHDLPLGVAHLMVTSWRQVYGLQCMAVYGHQEFAFGDHVALHEDLVSSLLATMGLEPHPTVR